MKTIKSLLILSTAAIFCTLIGSGCYTQLAISPDEPEAIGDSPTTIIINGPLLIPIIISHEVNCEATPQPFPTVGITTSGTATGPPASPPQRSTGYQRSSSSDQAQATSSNTGNRTAGSKRSGR